MSHLTSYSLMLPHNSGVSKNFLSRQQIIERNKKEKEMQGSRIQKQKIRKPQSVTKLSIQRQSTNQKKTFSCSKLQLNELIPEYQYFPKRKNEPLNSDYFNFVSKQKVHCKEEPKMDKFNQMREELMKSFSNIESMLL